MILTDDSEKAQLEASFEHDSSSLSSSSLSPHSPYPSLSLSSRTTLSQTSSSSASASGPSRLRPPPSPQSWAQYPGGSAAASDSALPLGLSLPYPPSPSGASSLLPPPSPGPSPGRAHGRAHSHSAVHLPPMPVYGAIQPASFTRPINYISKNIPFAPMFLLAEQNSLKQGFPVAPPPSTNAPHPFEVYDVSEADWREFLDQMRAVARLSPEEKHAARAVPIVCIIPFVNVLVATAIKHHMRSKKPEFVGLLVDKWNHHFFHPRSLEVILMRGQTRLSGQSDTPVPGLHTPKTVRFTTPPLPGSGANGADGDGSKTWRLFVVGLGSENM
ncbi:hypothetical protein HMN09_00480300 [Mycena chlorophos]|uniref:Uncharacterized protein n=1 Tax=Mycena chlorophos TaxID=658473 RepID=A0A8H6THK4_MYCCL|nr:hypothetical protein HMN09_00480300 [Mycena chlorophos]